MAFENNVGCVDFLRSHLYMHRVNRRSMVSKEFKLLQIEFLR